MSVECWASTLGDCSDGQSGEHYISDGIFDAATVTAFGLPWCREKRVTIGLPRAVAKILCAKHNNALSPFDAEAAKLSKFLRHNIHDQPLAEASVRLKGHLLEKWMLKTVLNLGYLRALNLRQSNRIDPPLHLIRHLYLNEPIADGVGLYYVTGPLSSDHESTLGVEWNSIGDIANDATIVAVTLIFFGLRFVVNILPIRAEEKLAAMGKVKDFDYSAAKIVYRPQAIGTTGGPGGQKLIEFQW